MIIRMPHFLALLFTLVCFVCNGQDDYLVTLQGDTLRGKIKLFTFDRKLDRVQVVTTEKKQEFTALEVRFLRFGNENFTTQRSHEGFKFMKQLVKGYLSLYAFQPENQNTYSGRQLVKLDGSTLEVPNLRFRAVMADFLAECPEVSEQVKKAELGRNELEKIIEEFNDCLATMPAIIDEEKPMSTAARDKLNLIKDLRSQVNKLDKFAGKSDAQDLLNDIAQKLRGNQVIPNYQKEALKELLGSQDSVRELLSNFLEALNKN